MVDKAEIVKIRKSTISHVSTSLKKLENKGLVEKIQSKDNKKHIEIILLDKAELIIEAGHNAQKQFAKNVLSGLTEEKQVCINIFDIYICFWDMPLEQQIFMVKILSHMENIL